MEKLLKKEVKFQWNEKCQKGLDTLKNKLVTMPILIFPYWKKEFHVHVDAFIHSFRFNTISTRGMRHRSSNYLYKEEAINNKKELYYHKMKRIENGICATEI
jgi:hypothetical protein